MTTFRMRIPVGRPAIHDKSSWGDLALHDCVGKLVEILKDKPPLGFSVFGTKKTLESAKLIDSWILGTLLLVGFHF